MKVNEDLLSGAFPGMGLNDDLTITVEQVSTRFYEPEIIGIPALSSTPGDVRGLASGAGPLVPESSHMYDDEQEFQHRRREATGGFRPKHLLSERSEPPLWVRAEDIVRSFFRKAVGVIEKGR